MSRNGQETALEWLNRVIEESNDHRIATQAIVAINQWQLLMNSWKSRGVKTRRSLWDLMSGIEQIGHSTTHKTITSEIRSGSDTFHFPIFQEACFYRGKKPPVGALKTGIVVLSHRMPQTVKWGNIVLKT